MGLTPKYEKPHPLSQRDVKVLLKCHDMLTLLNARTNVPLSSTCTPTFFQQT